MDIAVVGSREGIPAKMVEDYLEPRFREDVRLVSGGAPGVDSRAETYWRSRGGQVLSLRPVKNGDVWTIERVELTDRPRVFIAGGELEFEDWQSACWHRSMLIAFDIADRGVAFWDGKSRGTGHTIGLFEMVGKPMAVHRP